MFIYQRLSNTTFLCWLGDAEVQSITYQVLPNGGHFCQFFVRDEMIHSPSSKKTSRVPYVTHIFIATETDIVVYMWLLS